jgi:hypothetical protein
MPLLPIYCDKGPGPEWPYDFLVAARTVAAPGVKFCSYKEAFVQPTIPGVRVATCLKRCWPQVFPNCY